MTHAAETIAGLFHATYETLAPEHGYETRKASAVAWDDVPANNKALMIATVQHMLDTGIIRPGALVNHITTKAAASMIHEFEPALLATGAGPVRTDACGHVMGAAGGFCGRLAGDPMHQASPDTAPNSGDAP